MADFSKVEKALKERGYTVKVFATGAEAAALQERYPSCRLL